MTKSPECFNSLPEGLHRTGRVLRGRLVEALFHLGYDYPVEFWPTLNFVKSNPNASQHEIAAYLVRDKATVARLLSRMEREKLVKRTVDPKNRRQKLVEITEHGDTSFSNIASCAMDIRHHAEQGISAEDLQTCQHVLERVFANLNNNIT
ncbi:MAG: MarR family winged helix-turn-helix transcriptional regulator [Saprospiraceae bacterium]